MGTGNRIKELADRECITIKELSRRIDISYNTLYAIIRRDSKKIDADLAEKLAKELNSTTSYILGITPEQRETRQIELRYEYFIKFLRLNNIQCFPVIIDGNEYLSIRVSSKEGYNLTYEQVDKVLDMICDNIKTMAKALGKTDIEI